MKSLGIRARELDSVFEDEIRDMLVKRERKQAVPNQVVELRFQNEQRKRELKKSQIAIVSILIIIIMFSPTH